MNKSCHIRIRKESYKMYYWVMEHHKTYECVLQNIWMAKHMNESCKTYEWVMEPYKRYERVLQNIWRNHWKYMKESLKIYEGVIENICRNLMRNIWKVMQNIRLSHVTQAEWYNSFIYGPSCNMTHSYICMTRWYISHKNIRLSHVTQAAVHEWAIWCKKPQKPWAMPNKWRSYAKYINESCRYTNESCHMRGRIWMSYIIQRLIHIRRKMRKSHVT